MSLYNSSIIISFITLHNIVWSQIKKCDPKLKR